MEWARECVARVHFSEATAEQRIADGMMGGLTSILCRNPDLDHLNGERRRDSGLAWLYVTSPVPIGEA